MEAAVSMAGLAYIVNVILDEKKQIQAVFAVDFIRISLLPCNIEHMFLYRIAKNYRFVKTDIKKY